MPLKAFVKSRWKHSWVLFIVGIEIGSIGFNVLDEHRIGLVKKIRMVACPRWLAVGFRGLSFRLGFCVSSLMEIRAESLV